jgi:GT2 family glycosyltransferase
MGPAAVPTVAAVVVTHNRLAKLQRCIRSAFQQTRKPTMVVVVDNASSDGTSAWLASVLAEEAELPLRLLVLTENMGGAGGFHAGIKFALQHGADYVWVMDDDSYPRPDVLDLLLQAYEQHGEAFGAFPGFACARVVCRDGVSPSQLNTPTLSAQWDRPYTHAGQSLAAQSCSFVGCLFRAEDVRRVGLPLKEYFIWLDDVEFTRRLAVGTYGLVVLGAVVVHDIDSDQRVDWANVTEASAKKYWFGARNEASWRLHRQGFRSFFWFFRYIRNQMRVGRVPLKCRFAIYWAAMTAFWFNPRPEFPD